MMRYSPVSGISINRIIKLLFGSVFSVDMHKNRIRKSATNEGSSNEFVKERNDGHASTTGYDDRSYNCHGIRPGRMDGNSKDSCAYMIGGIDSDAITSLESNYTQQRKEKDILGDSYPNLFSFVFKNPANRWFVWTLFFAILIQFGLFKYFYPYASFISGDSYVYLETAYHNYSINTYPIGYSKFLRLISVFTKSDTIFVGLQYILVEIAALSLVFTIFYFYNLSRIAKIVLFSFMLFNPVFLYLANYVSSDAFFLFLSLVWFTMLIWTLNRPTNSVIIISSFILFIAFTVRYNALFYPFISVLVLILSKRKILISLLSFTISISLICVFINITADKYKEVSGHRQFTPFSGWQMANNALYAYRYVDSSQRKRVPKRLEMIDNIVRHYFDTTRDITKHPEETMLASTVYMWDPASPLTVYMQHQFKRDSAVSALKKWATVAPMMGDYGNYLIRTYPKEYLRYYLVPNAIKYYAPPVEFLDHYNMGIDSVIMIAKVWFDYKSNKVMTRFKNFEVNVLDFYPILAGVINVTLLLSIISFFVLRGYRYFPELKKGILLVSATWLINFGFSVLASPVALRFQLFPILVSLSFTIVLIDHLLKLANRVEQREHDI
ncbi:hypothetical protein [Chitinophaga eiseniae]|uniref:Dolichyl-phosphate-mannose-protein mannosyltransferase n=1 Tax=Chitinophaga eiseniae TaxID=634771 RepID=A0A847SUB7_9BACT|nr:hypothetical protein [Chitinophaga eiseniae]NLR81426.1 hypothetical protein [Chitinophaga eiseniae]